MIVIDGLLFKLFLPSFLNDRAVLLLTSFWHLNGVECIVTTVITN